MNKEIYFNRPQQEVVYTGANTNVIVAGRRLGKTFGIMAPHWLKCVQRMPRSTNAIIVPTYKHGKTNTIPGTLSAFESWGFNRDIHYFVGIKPPKKASFPDPYIRPENYENVISWYTGAIHKIISQDVEGSSNSNTFDSVSVDEARFCSFDKLKDETFPANGGTKAHFGHLSCHHSMMIVTDMPHNKKGQWVLNYKEKTDPQVLEAIHGLINEIYSLELKAKELIGNGEVVPIWMWKRVRVLGRDIEKLRRVALLYREYSSIDNLEVLGENYIKQMKRDLPPIVFQTSILCKPVGILKDGFYHNLREERHYYVSNNNSYLSSLEFDFDKLQDESSLMDGDVSTVDPICIAFDYNANINWLVSGQVRGNKLMVVKSYYVKYEKKLRELVRDFCRYNRFQINKTVVFYYDSTALGSNYAVDSEDFKDVIIKEFNLCGWNVDPVYIGKPIRHIQKHLLINQGLRGESGLFPMFNRDHNEALILSMERTGSRYSSHGFVKDKSGEKLAESEEDKLEYRTDGTDAFDTLYIGLCRFPYTGQPIMSATSR